MNFANRWQDAFIRRAVFSAGVQRRLAARGLDLDTIVRENTIGATPDDVLRDSVEEALEMAWGRNLGYDRFGRAVSGLNQFLTLGGKFTFTPLPFIRFMADALRFQFEFSPLGATRLLHPRELRALASGEPEQVRVAAKSLIGSSLLYSAYLIRNSEMAGPNWFEVKLPDGRTLDTRPFAPFSNYLFVADVITRAQDGTLLGLTGKELAQGLVGVNFRAGTGLFLVDRLFDALGGVDDGDKMLRIVKEYAGGVLAGFATPFQSLKDVITQFDPEGGVVRETGEAPLTGPARRRIPFADRSLPPAEIPTREAPFEREAPLFRQLSGLTLRSPPTAAEAELARLGFKRREVLTNTGDPAFDILTAKHLGPLVEQVVGAVVQAPRYQMIESNRAKAEVIRRMLPALRELARTRAIAADPNADIRRRFMRTPKRLRALIQELVEAQGGSLQLPE